MKPVWIAIPVPYGRMALDLVLEIVFEQLLYSSRVRSHDQKDSIKYKA